jgi:Seed dormancy control
MTKVFQLLVGPPVQVNLILRQYNFCINTNAEEKKEARTELSYPVIYFNYFKLIFMIMKQKPEAAMFDMEYARWLEEHHKLMFQMRAALEEHLPENQLQILVESALSHHEMLINIKSNIARSDVFHLTTGTWMSPAERCFLWIGGYRPGELIKVSFGT